MADGIVLERQGIQTASIVTDAFTRSGNAMAKTMGAEGYRYAMVPHPVSNLDAEQCLERARAVLPDVLTILGVEDGNGAAPAQTVPSPTATASDGQAAPAPDVTIEQARDARRLAEHYFAKGWTDGLPVVPTTRETVEAFVAYAGRDPQQQILQVPHLGTACTVELAAAAAAMAGCQKEHFPVLLAVLDSFQPSVDTVLLQSTSGQAVMVTVNGPIRQELGFNASTNVFGPGYRANATVGRAVRLVVMNALGIRPGEFDQGTQGTPGKYALCIAENEEESPWEPLHVERGFDANASVTTAHFARGDFPVDNRAGTRPEEILANIANTMSCSTASRGYAVVMGPEHAHLIARHGWSKQDAKQFLWEHWGRTRSLMRRFGLVHDGVTGAPLAGPASNDQADGDEFLHAGESADAILLVVAGARNAGMTTVLPMIRPMFHSKEIGAGG